MQRQLEDERPAADRTRFLAFGDGRPISGRRKETTNPGAASANPLGEGALRDQLHLQLAAEELALEFLVFPDVGRHHLADLAVPEEQADSEIVNDGVVTVAVEG